MTALLLPSQSWEDDPCPPRFATPRNYDRATLGPQAARIAQHLGYPLMPWQQRVADVALELDPETNLLWYRDVLLTVPRQSGKTTLILAVVVHRMITMERQNAVYTAQTRSKARQKWAEEHLPVLQSSIFGQLITSVRIANDSEHMMWQNGSRYGIEAGTETAGHGSTLDLAFVDEAFSEVDARKEQALKPTTLTRPEPQFWVVSTAGTRRRSHYLWSKVGAARARADSGRHGRVASFEWSAPDESQWDDPDTWRACMPALGHTISLAAVEATRDSMTEPEFRRAMLNQWPDGTAVEQVIDAGDWADSVDTASQMMPGTLVFAVDVAPDRSWSCIAVAGLRADGLEHIEKVTHRRGTTWLIPRIREIVQKWRPRGPVVLCGAPAGALVPDLTAANVDTVVMTLTDQRSACAQLFDGVPAFIRHRDQTELNVSVAGATIRKSGDGWVWERRGEVDITPLWAVTGARWGLGQSLETEYDVLNSIL